MVPKDKVDPLEHPVVVDLEASQEPPVPLGPPGSFSLSGDSGLLCVYKGVLYSAIMPFRNLRVRVNGRPGAEDRVGRADLQDRLGLLSFEGSIRDKTVHIQFVCVSKVLEVGVSW